MVLPAPVSPVTTVNPEESSRTASSITPRAVIRPSSSIGVLLSVHGASPIHPPPRGGPPAPAGHREAELGDQPVGEQRPAGLLAAVAAEPGQQHRRGTAAGLDPSSRRQIDTTPPLAPQKAGPPPGLARHPPARPPARPPHHPHAPPPP